MNWNLRPREEWARSGDDLDASLDRMSNWLSDLDRSGRVPPAALAFEALASALSALHEGVPADDVAKGYSRPEWQAATVEVPVALLETLVSGWAAYREAPTGKTLGECLDVEGGGQGRNNVRAAINQHKRETRLANEALLELLTGAGSWEAACAIVAEREGVSEATVRRASEPRRARQEAELRRRGVIV